MLNQGVNIFTALLSLPVPLQVNLQDNVRRVHASSQGGFISCTLPPSIGAVAADIEPISQATFGAGITYEVWLPEPPNQLTIVVQQIVQPIFR